MASGSYYTPGNLGHGDNGGGWEHSWGQNGLNPPAANVPNAQIGQGSQLPPAYLAANVGVNGTAAGQDRGRQAVFPGHEFMHHTQQVDAQPALQNAKARDIANVNHDQVTCLRRRAHCASRRQTGSEQHPSIHDASLALARRHAPPLT